MREMSKEYRKASRDELRFKSAEPAMVMGPYGVPMPAFIVVDPVAHMMAQAMGAVRIPKPSHSGYHPSGMTHDMSRGTSCGSTHGSGSSSRATCCSSTHSTCCPSSHPSSHPSCHPSCHGLCHPSSHGSCPAPSSYTPPDLAARGISAVVTRTRPKASKTPECRVPGCSIPHTSHYCNVCGNWDVSHNDYDCPIYKRR